jgi:hypothetical protein
MLLPVTEQPLVPEIVPEIVAPLSGALKDTVGAACALTAKTAAMAALNVVTRIASPFIYISAWLNDLRTTTTHGACQRAGLNEINPLAKIRRTDRYKSVVRRRRHVGMKVVSTRRSGVA